MLYTLRPQAQLFATAVEGDVIGSEVPTLVDSETFGLNTGSEL